MDVRVLGSLEVTVQGRPATPQGRGERELLAILATRAGRIVPTDVLIDALWGEDLPANPVNALQLRVSKLRRALVRAADVGDVLATHTRGYSLDVAAGAVDAGRFGAALAEARALSADGLVVDALERYRRASVEWRGAALQDFLHTIWAPPEAQHLENLRVAADEERLSLELAIGRHAEVLQEIETLASEHPLRERIVGLRMLALYRCGRQADALAAFRAARTVLDEDLGLEPGPELRELEAAILRQDPELAPPLRPASPATHAGGPTMVGTADVGRGPANGFVGRAAELQRLSGAVERAVAGEPQIVLLSGDAGMGKSTLLDQLFRTTEVPAFVGRSVQIATGSLPLAPAADLLRSIARGRGRELFTDPFLGPLASVSPALFGPVDAPAEGSPLQVFEAFLFLLGRLTEETPAIVVFEDLHWADGSTWDLLAFLSRCLSYERVVLVGTFRSLDGGPDARVRRLVAELTRMPQTTRIHLDGLDRDEVAAHAGTVLGASLTPAAVDELADRSGGNPFFVEQLASVVASGEPVPALLADLLAAEIELLPVGTDRLLGMVAVCGRQVHPELLRRMSDLAPEAFEASIRPALGARILALGRDDGAYSFRHALLTEVVDARLLPSERVRFHRRAAEEIEADPTLALGAVGGADAEIAHHWEAAGDTRRALPAAIAAADATQAVAPDAARRHLEMALRLCATLPDRNGPGDELARLGWRAAELAGIVGDGPAAVAHVLAATGGRRPDTAARAERYARYLWTAGDVPASIAEYDRALSLLDARTPAVEAAAVHAGVAQGHYLFRRFASAAAHASSALALLADAPEGPERDHADVRARSVLGAALCVMADVDRGVAEVRAAVSLALATQDTERYVTYAYLAEALTIAGRDEEVTVELAVAIAECARLGLDRSYGGYTQALAAESLIRLGRWEEAGELLEGFTARDPVPVTHLRVVGADVWLAVRRGELDRAELLLSTIDLEAADAHHRELGHRLRAELLLGRRRFPEAVELIRNSWAACPPDDRRTPGRYAWLLARAALAWTEHEDASADLDAVVRAAHDAVEEAGRHCRSPDSGQLSPEVAAYLADAEARVRSVSADAPGDVVADAWSAAAAAWERLGAAWHRASALTREATAALTAGDVERSRRCLALAHELGSRRRWQVLLDEPPRSGGAIRLSLDETADDVNR